MRALIAGGAGFIGSHLAEALLAAGHDVAVLDDRSTGRLENLRTVVGDPRLALTTGSVTDEDLVRNLVRDADVVYHLAAAVGVRRILASRSPRTTTGCWGRRPRAGGATPARRRSTSSWPSRTIGSGRCPS